jgi:hypothetical protein
MFGRRIIGRIDLGDKHPEAILKPRLRPDGCVASLFKMLTYPRVCCAFSSACALLSDLIRGFEMASNYLFRKSTPSNTNVEIDFSDQFIDNRSKGGVFGEGICLKMPSCYQAYGNSDRDTPFQAVILI